MRGCNFPQWFRDLLSGSLIKSQIFGWESFLVLLTSICFMFSCTLPAYSIQIWTTLLYARSLPWQQRADDWLPSSVLTTTTELHTLYYEKLVRTFGTFSCGPELVRTVKIQRKREKRSLFIRIFFGKVFRVLLVLNNSIVSRKDKRGDNII